MKAVRFHEYGGPEVLFVEEVQDIELGVHDVRVEVGACALNHVDLDIRGGSSRLPIKLPHTLGLEFAGVVVGVGSDVFTVHIGDRVTAMHQVHCGLCSWCLRGREELCENTQLFGIHRPGGYATHVDVPERAIIPIKAALSFEDAAACQTTFSTAWHALCSRARLMAGESVLVNAAGSGVGVAAVQVARLLGGEVFVSAGSDGKVAAALEVGAVAGVNYRSSDLAESVLELTDGRGVDVVMESVGGPICEGSIRALATNGRLVTVGAHAGEVISLDLIELFRKQISLLGSVRASRSELEHVLNLVSDGVVRQQIAARLPLDDVREAHMLLEAREVFGKVILEPNVGLVSK